MAFATRRRFYMSGETVFRVIRHEDAPRTAAVNMGIDESILHSVSDGMAPPTIRFYTWAPSAISLGYFQSLELEVDAAECRKRGVDVVRRITGGGAVYHDSQGELTYSIVVPEKSGILPGDILGSYRKVCDGIITGLSDMGARAEFRPLNDIVIEGRKISGNAQTRRRGCILQHGTILLDVDIDAMFSVLRVPSEKLRGKMIETVKASVTSLKHRLGSRPEPSAAADRIEAGMLRVIGGTPRTSALTDEEMDRALSIARERYGNDVWTARR